MSKISIFKIEQPNLIGQLGKVIATSIIKKLFNRQYRILRSHTYPYCTLDFKTTERADFELHGKNEIILVEVKTSVSKKFRPSGSSNRRYLEKELENYKKHEDVTKILILKISLVNFPNVRIE